MKNSGSIGFRIITAVFFALLAFLIGFASRYNSTVFIISVCLAAVLLIVYFVLRSRIYRGILNGISASVYKMAGGDTATLDNIVTPVFILSQSGSITWCNKAFSNNVFSRNRALGNSVQSFIGQEAYDKLIHFKTAEFALGDKIFKAFLIDGKEKTVYLVDQTALKRTAAEYRFSRPVAAVLEIDALDEALKGERGSKKIQIVSKIQELIEAWFSHTNGIISTLSESSYLLIFEHRYLKRFEEEKFRIVEDIRELEVEGNKRLTVSVGVGYGCKTLHENEGLAHEALEMALSRGGDQAAIKALDEDYRFYGGVKSAEQKGSRVRTRVTAQAIREAILNSGRVLVMGHRFSDFDSLGAALGICFIAKYLGVKADIVIDKNATMAKPMVKMIEKAGFGDMLITAKEALDEIYDDTLTVVVDTHRPSFVESPEVYEKSKRVIVIDHHRRATDYISNAMVFYNETVASAASEIVTELWQYIIDEKPDKTCANALLAGIMLDTKNFVLNTGVRTYEASAYLRKSQANPVEVRKLFADSLDIEKAKYSVIAGAEKFMDCAIAINPESTSSARLVSAQAADFLLDVEGVKASFVLYALGEDVNASARSYGEINVQLVMEKLGGGGHRTMSGALIKNTNLPAAKLLLQEKIQEYFNER